MKTPWSAMRVVLQADINATDNVLARLSDAEITLFTKHTVAKEIRLKQTQKFQQQLSVKQKADVCICEETLQMISTHRVVAQEAKTGKNKPKSREGTKRKSLNVNPTANHPQLTLFNFGDPSFHSGCLLCIPNCDICADTNL